MIGGGTVTSPDQATYIVLPISTTDPLPDLSHLAHVRALQGLPWTRVASQDWVIDCISSGRIKGSKAYEVNLRRMTPES